VRRSLALLALLAAVTGCSGHRHSLDRYGLTLDLPHGWTGEVYRRAKDLVILHAASFRLGPHDGYDPLGTIERDDRLVDARTGMRTRDVGISIFAYANVPGPPAPTLRGDLAIGPSDRKDMEGFPPLRATYARTFTAGGRQIQLIVEFGSGSPPPDGFDRVNGVLRTFSVSAD
jgi:hypothetical protein